MGRVRADREAERDRLEGLGHAAGRGRVAVPKFRGDDRIDPERTARAVFTMLAKRVTTGESEDVKHVVPAKMRDLWPAFLWCYTLR